jgi:hypothetical protein
VGFAPGEVGQAFSFAGTGSQVSIATPNFQTPNTGFTVEAWVNPTSLGTCPALTCNTVAHRERSMQSRTWWLGIDGPSIRFLILRTAPNSGAGDVSSPAVVTTGSFQHVAATYDGNSIKLYHNGVLVTTQVVGAANFNTGDPINIGIENLTVSGTVDPFRGLIDELSIYNRALSDSEITAIVGAGTSGKCPPVVPGDGGVPPADGGVVPADGGVVPPDGGVVPADGGVVGGDCGVVPEDDDDNEYEDEDYNGRDYHGRNSNGRRHNARGRDRYCHNVQNNGNYNNGRHDDGDHDDGRHGNFRQER